MALVTGVSRVAAIGVSRAAAAGVSRATAAGVRLFSIQHFRILCCAVDFFMYNNIMINVL